MVILAFSWLSFGSIWTFQLDAAVSLLSFSDMSVNPCAMSQAWNINPPPSAVFQQPSGWHDPRAVFLSTHPIQDTAPDDDIASCVDEASPRLKCFFVVLGSESH